MSDQSEDSMEDDGAGSEVENKSDVNDSCEEDDNSDVSHEDDEDEDEDELSLANSGSDLDSCQSENEFREAVDIEATKEELIETFKQKLNILQSEKKWFQSGCDLKTEIEDEIEGLREVYKGYSSTGEYLPNARLNEFRVELGKCLSGMKLVRKLCNVISKMYPRDYRDKDEDYLYVPFRNIFDLIVGLSGVSDVVSKDVASEDVFLDKLVAMMKYTRGQMFKDTLGESDAELQKKAFKCLHNLAMDHRNYQKLRDKNFVDIIWSHFEDEAEENEDYEMQAGLEIIAYGALAALLDERESEAGHLHEGVVDYFKDELKECLECDDDDNRSPRKIVRIIRRLARNDCYKKNFGRRDIIPLLVETADRDSIRDQIESTGAIWELSFIEENQKKLLKNKEAMTMLELSRRADNIDISNNCKGALWNMRDLLSNKNQYKHLDENQNSRRGTNNNDTKGNETDNGSGHIMISYQWHNQKTLIKIRDELKNKGYKVWMDIDNMKGSTLEAMAEAVEKASVVLLCSSQKYKNSPNCRLEAEYAFQQGRAIIPLKMEKEYKADGWLGLLIGAKLFFDFSGKYPFEEKIKGLFKELDSTIPSTGKNNPSDGNNKLTLKRQKTEPFISLSHLNALKDAFSEYDQDGNDRLSVSELGGVLRSIGLNPTQAEIEDIMENADSDGNGFIDYQEYISLLKSYMKPQTEIQKELKEAFKLFSRGSGSLNIKQLRSALTKLGEKLSEDEVEELFDMMDENEDGVVDVDEFVKHLCAR